MMKGWLVTQPASEISAERLLSTYHSTGNEKYLTLLVERFNQRLYHYLLSQSNKAMAEDALQNTWLKVIKANLTNNATSQQISNVKSWLFTIARNTLIDECRRQQKWHWLELSDECMTTGNLTKQLDAADELARFNIAVNALPFYQREALIFQQEGFSIVEICQLTNENFETIKSRLRYAKHTLKACLEVNT